jgi:hypothetical protein
MGFGTQGITVGQHGAHSRKQRQCKLCQFSTSTGTVKEPPAQFFLQRSDAATQRRLCDLKRGRSPGQTAVFGNTGKGTQGAQIEFFQFIPLILCE